MSLNAETASIYQALGLRENARLPDGPIGPVIAPVTGYNGIVRHHWTVRLATRDQANVQRVQAQCPCCGNWFAAGNLGQHLKGYRTRRGIVPGCAER